MSKAIRGCRIIVSVGDRTTETLIQMGFTPDVQVVDGLEARKPRPLPFGTFATEMRVRNPAGHVSDEAVHAIQQSSNQPKPLRIVVEGEEDLLALPFLAVYPEGIALLYGQPGEGIVVVVVNKGSKGFAKDLLTEMGVKLS